MDEEEVSSGGGGGVSSLYKLILLGLCSNFNIYQDPMSEQECVFKTKLKYDMMDMKGKTIKVTTVEKPPLSGTMMNEKGELVGTGVAFNMLHEIQDQLGFKYQIIKPDINEIGNETHGAIKLLLNKEVDMAVMFFPMLKEYRKWVQFSQSLGEFEWVLLMKRPLASATGSGLLAPFEANVWFAILASVVAVGPIVYGLILLRVKLCKDDEEVNRFFPLPACMWFVYGALMKQGTVLSPISDSARILFATWWIFITILTSFYTANLTAFLTLSQFTLTIKEPKDIYAYKRQWTAEGGGHTYEMINNAEELKQLKSMIPQYGKYMADSAVASLFDQVMKDVIYVGEKRKSTKLILNDYLNKTDYKVPEVQRCTYVLSTSFITKPVAFAYPRGGDLYRILNPMFSAFVQGGIVDFLLNKPLPLTTICPLNLPSSERKLRNGDLKTTYYVVGAGFAFAALAFIGEVINRWHKRGKLKGLSINSGDISNTLFHKKNGGKDMGHYSKNIKGAGDMMNSADRDYALIRVQENNKSPSAFLFQYTN